MLYLTHIAKIFQVFDISYKNHIEDTLHLSYCTADIKKNAIKLFWPRRLRQQSIAAAA